MNNKISARNWTAIWLLGLVGQICWNIENQWFNTFVYAKIAPDPSIIAWMTAVSATITTLATFIFGTMSDRAGKRKPLILIGYILWGAFTILFGVTEFIPKSPIIFAVITVVAMDAVMSFFGSLGNDCGFSAWTTDITCEKNRGQLGTALASQPIIAMLLGTVVAGGIIAKYDYFAFFTMVGVIVMIIGVLGFFVMKESENLKPIKHEDGFMAQLLQVFNFKTLAKNKQLFLVFLTATVYFTCFNMFFMHALNYFIYTLGFSEGDSGVILGVGLIIAIAISLLTIKPLNKGKHGKIMMIAIVLSCVGLAVLGIAKANILIIYLAVVLVGSGYVISNQTIMAWQKNLFPEGSRGQFEGVRIIFVVLIPMIIGPSTANIIIKNYGLDVVINGVAGKSPTEILFYISGALFLLTFIPLFMALKQKKDEVN